MTSLGYQRGGLFRWRKGGRKVMGAGLALTEVRHVVCEFSGPCHLHLSSARGCRSVDRVDVRVAGSIVLIFKTRRINRLNIGTRSDG